MIDIFNQYFNVTGPFKRDELESGLIDNFGMISYFENGFGVGWENDFEYPDCELKVTIRTKSRNELLAAFFVGYCFPDKSHLNTKETFNKVKNTLCKIVKDAYN